MAVDQTGERLVHEMVHAELWAYAGEPFVCDKCQRLISEPPKLDLSAVNVQLILAPSGIVTPGEQAL